MKFELKTAGSAQGNLVCSSVSSWCGDIKMGIALEFVNYPYSIVVDFKDFETVYLFAKDFRNEHAGDINKDVDEL